MGVFKDHCKPNHQCRLVMILISPMYTHQTSELERPTVDTEPHLVQEVWSVWWWYPGSCPGLHCYNQPSSAICCPSHPTLALHNNQTWNAITRERERERERDPGSFSSLLPPHCHSWYCLSGSRDNDWWLGTSAPRPCVAQSYGVLIWRHAVGRSRYLPQ